MTAPALAAGTWNTCDASISVTGGGLTASTTTTGWKGCLVANSTGHSSGKYYYELTVSACSHTTSNSHDIGAGNSSYNTGNYVGADTNSTGYAAVHTAAGVLYYNGTGTGGSPQAPCPTGTMGFAVEMDSAGSCPCITVYSNYPSNPTSTAFTSRTLPTGSLYPAWAGDDSGSTVTLNTTGPFTLGLPSGFSAWDPTSGATTTGNLMTTLGAGG